MTINYCSLWSRILLPNVCLSSDVGQFLLSPKLKVQAKATLRLVIVLDNLYLNFSFPSWLNLVRHREPFLPLSVSVYPATRELLWVIMSALINAYLINLWELSIYIVISKPPFEHIPNFSFLSCFSFTFSFVCSITDYQWYPRYTCYAYPVLIWISSSYLKVV